MILYHRSILWRYCITAASMMILYHRSILWWRYRNRDIASSRAAKYNTRVSHQTKAQPSADEHHGIAVSQYCNITVSHNRNITVSQIQQKSIASVSPREQSCIKSSREPGFYQIICSIKYHRESKMSIAAVLQSITTENRVVSKVLHHRVRHTFESSAKEYHSNRGRVVSHQMQHKVPQNIKSITNTTEEYWSSITKYHSSRELCCMKSITAEQQRARHDTFKRVSSSITKYCSRARVVSNKMQRQKYWSSITKYHSSMEEYHKVSQQRVSRDPGLYQIRCSTKYHT